MASDVEQAQRGQIPVVTGRDGQRAGPGCWGQGSGQNPVNRGLCHFLSRAGVTGS